MEKSLQDKESLPTKTKEKTGLPAETHVKAGYKKTKLGWIPEDWEISHMGKLFTPKQGIQCPVELQQFHQDNNMVRFIRIIDLTNPKEAHRYIDNPGGEHIISNKDLFMVRYGTPGLVGYGYHGVIANNMFRLIPNEEIDTLYFKYLFIKNQARLKAIASSSTMPALNFSSLNSFTLVYPPLPEQQKIAQILSTWDKAIAKQEALITQKQKRKKGLMQQLLTGKKRFTEFVKSDKMKKTKLGQVPEDWEVYQLKELANYRRGSFPQPYGLPEWIDEENGHPFVQVFDVNNNMRLKPKTKLLISDL